MRRRLILVAESAGAIGALAVAVLCWMRGVTGTEFEPVAPGAPPFTSMHYSGSWITAAFAAVVVAGLLALAVRRRLRQPRYP
ncbi:hypothetical protein [Rhodococcus sp. SGAir0479]|uniref:hypothetical protein n=1 Tax=Rhodococcus sp. SGAir0479 TaxID=2567884 RepID=UPI001586C31D|nr:hypothetical protein [Rhodococcus sp. SGAir0479]